MRKTIQCSGKGRDLKLEIHLSLYHLSINPSIIFLSIQQTHEIFAKYSHILCFSLTGFEQKKCYMLVMCHGQYYLISLISSTTKLLFSIAKKKKKTKQKGDSISKAYCLILRKAMRIWELLLVSNNLLLFYGYIG